MVSADTLVLSVHAADRDSGLNGKITYRLLSSPLQGFYIHPDNGKNNFTDGKDILLCFYRNVPLAANYHCLFIEHTVEKGVTRGIKPSSQMYCTFFCKKHSYKIYQCHELQCSGCLIFVFLPLNPSIEIRFSGIA